MNYQRNYVLNMPQMHCGGMYENWLLKEWGDMHWHMLSQGLGVHSDEVTDSTGERLYASFVRIRWESSKSLFAFKENDSIGLESELSRYGNKMFFSDSVLTSGTEKIQASLFSVFSSRTDGDNKSLKKGEPRMYSDTVCNTLPELPAFAKEYLSNKAVLSDPQALAHKKVNLQGLSFPFSSEQPPVFQRDYSIEPYDDVNGVGLLYFASYPKISDKCERLFFHSLYQNPHTPYDWATVSSCVARDVFYFGNANPGEHLIYHLDGCYLENSERLVMVSSLYRQGDGQLIARIFTIKHILQADVAHAIQNALRQTDREPPVSWSVQQPVGRSISAEKPATHAALNELPIPPVSTSREELTHAIVRFVSSMLGLEGLSAQTELNGLGIESIVLIELSEYLHTTFQIKANPSRFFGLARIADMVDYVWGTQKSTPPVPDLPPLPQASANGKDIAIIGYSFRFPGATTQEELWALLKEGNHALSSTPTGRWTWPEGVDVEQNHRGINKGGYIADIEAFDAAFFRISPREALLMDPQQRILLELAWQVFEQAGYSPSDVRGSRTGVYIGASGSDYEMVLREQQIQDALTGTSTLNALLANRISYFYDLQGPSIQLDTACSSSLVAVHQAVQALQTGECTQAVVGAVHLMCHPTRSLAYYQAGMLSPDGQCHTFDEKANGYVRGEGAALLLLKPLSQALADGDRVEGIIKGTAVNHGGLASGLTVPSPVQQRQLLEEAYTKAGIDIRSVSYIEAHGTGTSLGDPIEVASLTAAFRNLEQKQHPGQPPAAAWCGVGSVKTNLGHLEAAAGMAGILKVLVAMAYRTLPSTLSFGQLNPHIELDESPFYIQAASSVWAPEAVLVRAGVSSFGIGGTNGHVVLESAPQRVSVHTQAASHAGIFVLSARTTTTLHHYATLFRHYLATQPESCLESIAYTLQVGREAMTSRLAIVYDDIASLLTGLDAYLHDTPSATVYTHATPPVACPEWLSGSGSLSFPSTRQERIHLAQYWVCGGDVTWKRMYVGTTLQKRALPTYPFERKLFWVGKKIENKPFEYQKYTLLTPPDPMPGTPPVAASASRPKVVLVPPTLYLSKEKPMLPNATPMTEAEVSEKVIRILCELLYMDVAELDMQSPFIKLGLDSILGVEFIKAINKQFQTDIKAARLYDYATIPEFCTYLVSVRVPATVPLPAPANTATKVRLQPLDTHAASTETTHFKEITPDSTPITSHEIYKIEAPQSSAVILQTTTDALAQEIRTLLYMDEEELDVEKPFIELGLDSVLSVELIKKINALFKTTLKASHLYAFPTCTSLAAHIASLSGHPAEHPVAEPLPTIPASKTIDWELIQVQGSLTEGSELQLHYTLTEANCPFLADHRVFGHAVLPTDAYLELLYAACRTHLGIQALVLEGIRINQPLVSKDEAACQVTVEFKKQGKERIRFVISSTHASENTIHMRGFICLDTALQPNNRPWKESGNLPDEKQFSTDELAGYLIHTEIKGCYHKVRQHLCVGRSYAIGTLRVTAPTCTGLIAQILDGALLYAIQFTSHLFDLDRHTPVLYLPYQLERVWLSGTVIPGHDYHCRLHCDEKGDQYSICSLEVTDSHANRLLHIEGLQLRAITPGQLVKEPTVSTDLPTGIPDPPITAPAATDVAIIGMAGRFPGAATLEAFWQNLVHGVDAIEEIPAEKWDGYEWYHPDPHHENTSYSKWAGFVSDVDRFDALFFGISPYEAEIMDPQQRLFLEECWKAIEDAACIPSELARRKVGVFVGAGAGDYLQLLQQQGDGKQGAAFTGSSQAVLAARISYLLNLTGPALTLDTACSSSLAAIDRAYQSLVSGECEMALAGGVALLTTPLLHIWTSQVGMPSPEGRCKTFDDTANGIVSSEAVGVLVLKRLKDAQRDNDRIYAVIKGSGINQDGRTNGITAPSTRSQAELQTEVYHRYQINPATITYVEAHGTGTKLGDPIEIDALTQSFGAYTSARHYCAIGSVKTNIGHPSYAAGVVSVIKTALMMYHRTLVPSLHCTRINTEIDIENTPFYIPTKHQPWITAPDTPLRAGINSFGFSGTNVHTVLEAAPVPAVQVQDSPLYAAVVVLLSAKTTERLQEQAQNLMHYLQNHPEAILADIAYTLQTGREPMEERLAMVCTSNEALQEQLTSYLAGRMADVYTGSKQKKSDNLTQAQRMQEIATALTERNVHVLAQHWTQGQPIAWTSLYTNQKPQKISLPAYPFARERHWLPRKKALTLPTLSQAILHPLVHENTSTLHKQRYSSTYTGEEGFLKDHLVRNQKILPGMAYLEMVREAATRALEHPITHIKDIIWQKPVCVDTPQTIHVAFSQQPHQVGYEVYSIQDGQEIVHSTGYIATQPLTRPEKIDLPTLQRRLPNLQSQHTFYEFLQQKGFQLGNRFQGVEVQYSNENEALAYIRLPKDHTFSLNPGMLDSGLQNCLAWILKQENKDMALPFSIRECILYEPLPDTVWSYARKSHTSQAHDKVVEYDVDLLNEEGETLLSFNGCVFLPVGSPAKPLSAAQTHFYTTQWQEMPLALQSQPFVVPLIVLAGGTAQMAEELQAMLEVQVEAFYPDHEEAYCTYILHKIKEQQSLPHPTRLLIVCHNSEYHHYGFVSGLLRTAQLENTSIIGSIIATDAFSIAHLDTLAQGIQQEISATDDEVMYVQGKRYVKTMVPLATPHLVPHTSFKEGGVYVVTGGAGGLGQVWARYIRTIPGTHVVLVGRKAASDVQLPSIPSVSYQTCDITDLAQVTHLLKVLQEKHGHIDGILHGAGLIRDTYIRDKQDTDLAQVLAPKIIGTRNLDLATRDIPLDFLVFFSSVAAVFGNIGQADYAAANAYMDAYAHYREQERSKGNRYGKTLSINWPLWQEGGMQVHEEVERYLKHTWGMHPLPTHEGLKALEALLQTTVSQGIVLYGNPTIAATSSVTHVSPVVPQQAPVADLSKQVVQTVTHLASKLSKVAFASIQPTKDLGDYGFDSILYTKFCNELNTIYALTLTPTLFFNCPTLNDLAAFLVTHHSPAILAAQQPLPAGRLQDTRPVSKPSSESAQPQHVAELSRPIPTGVQPVAVVGISGRFPGASDIQSFWENLVQMKDLITEVPPERWDWQQYYGDPQIEKNRTQAKWGGFIEDIDAFDPLFFSISPIEATLMDPQQRMVLEAVYHALEDAGISPDTLRGSHTGVCIGVSSSDYSSLVQQHTDWIGMAQFATGSAHSVLVNRLSYWFDWHGPSEPIDTACSGSLIAIHRAVENIRNGHCEVAIAGGVNAILSPELTLSFSQAGMLSVDGRCKTFDQQANGYVRGEGVGIVVLKSLDKAQQDGDRIYGVIRATAENHGGKANTLTSPNPRAQKDLLLKAYRRANIDPRQVSYIEAHGTGTALGDPIETEGLKLAFDQLYADKGLPTAAQPHCALGSVKTNIGHLEAAAGVAGVIKVLLALQHHTIPGNPHLRVPNAYLRLQQTPFYLQTDTTHWPAAPSGHPRLAGISSFGFGGANAHIVVEEYIPTHPTHPIAESQPMVFLLSAKGKDPLQQQVRNLLAYLKTPEGQQVPVQNIAYTLQIGRSHLEDRLAVVATTHAELQTYLLAYLHQQTESYPEAIFTGTVAASFRSEEDTDSKDLEKIRTLRQYAQLAQRWTQGTAWDWHQLYTHRPQKCRLPLYPFARQRYWIPKTTPLQASAPRLHPLVHRNESDASGLTFTSSFTGTEYFFTAHKVQGRNVLPGAAQIELIREAAAQSTGRPVTQLTQIVFQQPIQENGKKSIDLTVTLQPVQGQLAFTLAEPTENRVCSQGTVSHEPLPASPPIHIPDVQARLHQRMSKEDYYHLLHTKGIDYGKEFQGIQWLAYSTTEVLSEITLPRRADYHLPPDLLDSAVQTVMGLCIEFDSTQPAYLPFSVREVNLYHPLPATFWSYARKNTPAPGATLPTYDVDLIRPDGTVCVCFRGFVALPLTQSPTTERKAIAPPDVCYVPVWERVRHTPQPISLPGSHVVTGVPEEHAFATAWIHYMQQQGHSVQYTPSLAFPPAGMTHLYLLQGLSSTPDDRPEDSFAHCEMAVFRVLKHLLASAYADKPLYITVFTHKTQKIHAAASVQEKGSGIVGLVRSFAKEHPLWQIRLMDIDAAQVDTSLLKSLLHTPYTETGTLTSYRNGYAYERSLCPIQLPAPKTSKFRHRGTYVLLGGAGGIGKVTTQYLVEKYQAQVIWLGRRPLDATIRKAQQEVALWGVMPDYISCDATQPESMQAAYQLIQSRYGTVHGLFHAAIVLQDALVRNMDTQAFRNAFDPKAYGSHYFIEAFQNESLDFVCFYSSLQSQVNAAGQANYSAGCTYKDSFAHSIQSRLSTHVHIINWGYWGEVGVVASGTYQQRMRMQGIGSITPEEGMQILETVLANEQEQIIATKFV